MTYDAQFQAQLNAEIALLSRANRRGPQPVQTAATIAAGGSAIAGTPAALPSLTHQTIEASAPGENILVTPPGATMQIMELVVWNTVTQTLIFQDGQGEGAVLLLRLTQFPANSGYTLQYTGQPHMEVSPGRPFVLNLGAGLVDGYVRYKSA